MNDPVLERLVADGALSVEDAARAASQLARTGGSVDSVLLELRLVPAARLPEILARVSGLPAAPDSAFATPDPRARRVFPAKVAERHAIAPFALDGRELSVVTTFPPDARLLEELGFLLSLSLRPHVAPEWKVRALVQQLYGAPVPDRIAGLAGGPVPPPSEASTGTDATGGVPDPAWMRAPGWTPEQAREEVAAATTPDDAIRVALRAARDRLPFAAAFTVRRDTLCGHDALGHDPDAREGCRRIVVSLQDPGLFGPPLETRAPYLGPPPSDPITAAVLSGLGRVAPRTVLVAPVWIGDRAACVLYADNDDAPVSSGQVAELFPLLAALGESLARMIRDRKSAPPSAAEAKEPSSEDAPPADAPPFAAAPPAVLVPAPPVVMASPAPPAGEDWSVVEPARVEPEPLRFSVDVDLGEYEVISAGEALASGRAEDIPSLVEALAASRRGSPSNAFPSNTNQGL